MCAFVHVLWSIPDDDDFIIDGIIITDTNAELSNDQGDGRPSRKKRGSKNLHHARDYGSVL